MYQKYAAAILIMMLPLSVAVSQHYYVTARSLNAVNSRLLLTL